jgi:hypothetical protein
MTIDEILSRLENVKSSGSGFTAHCPAHDDKNSSLSINIGDDGKILIKCFAGCEFKKIVEAMGLKESDFFPEKKKNKASKKTTKDGLTLDQLANAKKLPVDFLKSLGLKDWKYEDKPAVLMPYFDEKGEQLVWRYRIALDGKDKFRSKSGERLALYGLDMLAEIKQAGWVLIVEGESDRWTCVYHKIPCLAVPGKNNWKDEWKTFLDGLDTYVYQEPGAEKFTASIAKSLPDIKVILASDYKDVSDAHINDVDVADYIENAKARARVYGPPLTRDLIYSMRDFIDRFIVFKNLKAPLLIGTWVVATYIYEAFEYFPILWINSPTKRCGKSKLVDILDKIVSRSSGTTINTSASALFRLTAEGCTFLADEVESMRGADKEKFGDLMSILNSGFQKGAVVTRATRNSDEIKRYPVYGPKVLSGINSVADTIADRSLAIKMARQSKGEKKRKEKLKFRKLKDTVNALQSDATMWTMQNARAIQKIYDNMTEEPRLTDCDDRFIDIVEPLVAVLKFADSEAANGGSRILDEVMPILLELSGLRDEAQADESIAALCVVLDDILGTDKETWIASADLLERFKQTEGLKWIGSTKGVATFLNKLGIYPNKFENKTNTGDRKRPRGYKITREIVDDLRSRYAHSEFDPSQASQSQQSQ